MKFIQLTSPKYPIWQHGMPTGITKAAEHFINPLFIVSISLYEGKNLHAGWYCSKVVVNEGGSTSTYYDVRLPNLLRETVEQLI